PAARHTKVAAKNDSLLEAEEQVLADRLDPEKTAAVEPLGEPLDRRPRMRRLDLHLLAHQHLQSASGSRQGVPFGHREGRSTARRGPARKPAWTRRGIASVSVTAWPSNRSTARRFRPLVRT